MNIFVAGATGVVGGRAVVELLATGARVTAIARSAQKRAELERLGATPTQVDLFDHDGLMTAVAGHDVVCNLATAIPTGPGAAEPAAWAVNDRIRREGVRNLVDAAIEAGAVRFVQESIVLLYADGGDWLSAFTNVNEAATLFGRAFSMPHPAKTFTAVTRARQHAIVCASPSMLEHAVAQRTQRASGLREALWGSGS